MNATTFISDGFGRWIDAVAGSCAHYLDRLSPKRAITLYQVARHRFEQAPNHFFASERSVSRSTAAIDDCDEHGIPGKLLTASKITQVDLVLLPDHFLFRTVELPSGAGEFLDGIVRTQIDRLTPWNGPDAAFGWSEPIPAGTDQISCTVAATARSLITPYIAAVAALGVRSTTIYVNDPNAPTLPAIKVWAQRTRQALDISRLRKILLIVLACAAAGAVFAASGAAVIGDGLDSQQDELARKVANASHKGSSRFDFKCST